MTRQAILILIAGCMISGISGCATTGPQLEEAMAMAKQAQADASAARKAAEAASRTASEAKRDAASAKSAANEAASAARRADGCCAANSEKIERMFRESMKK